MQLDNLMEAKKDKLAKDQVKTVYITKPDKSNILLKRIKINNRVFELLDLFEECVPTVKSLRGIHLIFRNSGLTIRKLIEKLIYKTSNPDQVEIISIVVKVLELVREKIFMRDMIKPILLSTIFHLNLIKRNLYSL